jgi:hypothetical protein
MKRAAGLTPFLSTATLLVLLFSILIISVPTTSASSIINSSTIQYQDSAAPINISVTDSYTGSWNITYSYTDEIRYEDFGGVCDPLDFDNPVVMNRITRLLKNGVAYGINHTGGGTWTERFTDISINSGDYFTVSNPSSYHCDGVNAWIAGYPTDMKILFDITGDSPPLPNITSWGNNYTNNNSLSFVVERLTNVTFNITSNQTLTSCSWVVATQINCTANSYSYKYFDTAGTFYVNISGSNANGSTINSKNWTITVTETASEEYIPPTPINLDYTETNTEVNFSWIPGIGNITNSYNVYLPNSTWSNGSSTFININKIDGWNNISVYAVNTSNNTMNSTPATLNEFLEIIYNCYGTGGTISSDGEFRIHTFYENDTLVFSGNCYVEYLVVGSGGSGGPNGRGGGGGGQVFNGTILLSPQEYTITVGTSDTGANNGWTSNNASSGTNAQSIFLSVTAVGGYDGSSPTGGGLFATGGTGTDGIASNGSEGITNNITGTNICYAGGGSGGGTGVYGKCGGGNGTATIGENGTNNTGGGGAGGTDGGNGGAGGSGIVIIKYVEGKPAATYIPPSPINISVVQSGLNMNYSWEPGVGENITDYYNIYLNNIWTNNSSAPYFNSSFLARAWGNISVYAVNTSMDTINETALSAQTQLSNNIPMLQIDIINLSSSNVFNDTFINDTIEVANFTDRGLQISPDTGGEMSLLWNMSGDNNYTLIYSDGTTNEMFRTSTTGYSGWSASSSITRGKTNARLTSVNLVEGRYWLTDNDGDIAVPYGVAIGYVNNSTKQYTAVGSGFILNPNQTYYESWTSYVVENRSTGWGDYGQPPTGYINLIRGQSFTYNYPESLGTIWNTVLYEPRNGVYSILGAGLDISTPNTNADQIGPREAVQRYTSHNLTTNGSSVWTRSGLVLWQNRYKLSIANPTNPVDLGNNYVGIGFSIRDNAYTAHNASLGFYITNDYINFTEIPWFEQQPTISSICDDDPNLLYVPSQNITIHNYVRCQDGVGMFATTMAGDFPIMITRGLLPNWYVDFDGMTGYSRIKVVGGKAIIGGNNTWESNGITSSINVNELQTITWNSSLTNITAQTRQGIVTYPFLQNNIGDTDLSNFSLAIQTNGSGGLLLVKNGITTSLGNYSAGETSYQIDVKSGKGYKIYQNNTLLEDNLTWVLPDDSRLGFQTYTSGQNLSVDNVSINQTQINVISQNINSFSMNETDTVYLYLNTSDIDNDALTFNKNTSFGSIIENVFNYTAGLSDGGTYSWNFNVSDGYNGLADKTIAVMVNGTNYTKDIPIYTSGWQPLLVNDTMTTSQFNSLYGVIWLSYWNATSQKFVTYKAGWPYRQSLSLAKGAGVYALVSANKTITMTMNNSMNWTLRENYNLVGCC